jgi:hypothetical protein
MAEHCQSRPLQARQGFEDASEVALRRRIKLAKRLLGDGTWLVLKGQHASRSHFKSLPVQTHHSWQMNSLTAS